MSSRQNYEEALVLGQYEFYKLEMSSRQNILQEKDNEPEFYKLEMSFRPNRFSNRKFVIFTFVFYIVIFPSVLYQPKCRSTASLN